MEHHKDQTDWRDWVNKPNLKDYVDRFGVKILEENAEYVQEAETALHSLASLLDKDKSEEKCQKEMKKAIEAINDIQRLKSKNWARSQHFAGGRRYFIQPFNTSEEARITHWSTRHLQLFRV